MQSRGTTAALVADRLGSEGFAVIPIGRDGAIAAARTMRAATRFFSTSVAERMSATLPHDCGYLPEGTEYSRDPDHPDAMQSFTAAHRSAAHARRLASRSGRELHHCMTCLLDALAPLARAIVEELLRRSVRPHGQATSLRTIREWSSLQANFSLPSTAASDYINLEHEDGNLLTLTFADGPGLEVRRRDGSFSPVHAAAGTVAVFPSSIARLVTRGACDPTFHRVRAHRNLRTRVSITLFGDIAPDDCLAWLTESEVEGIRAELADGPARFGRSPLHDGRCS